MIIVDDITVRLYRLSSSIVTLINNQLRQYHLTFQQLSFLIFLSKQEKSMNIKDIGDYFGIWHPTTVGLISRMVARDLLLVSPLESDRRQTVVMISKHGYDTLKKTKEVIDKVNEQCFDVLKKEDFEKFL